MVGLIIKQFQNSPIKDIKITISRISNNGQIKM